MSILKRGADLVYTFRFIRMLVMKWENWDAYKLKHKFWILYQLLS